MSEDNSQTSPYPAAPLHEDGGGLNMDYIRSIRGILNFAVVGLLFLGFVCAVSVTLPMARIVDSCNKTTVRINVRASSVAYMFFVVLTLVIFAVLAILNSVSNTMFSSVRAFLSKMITVALVMVLGFIIFVVSSTQCTSEHKMGQSNSATNCDKVRLGGPGAACFFGYMAIIAMILFAAMTFME